MAQANTDNSTSMPIDHTRRRFLSQAVGMAASGTALALATIPPASASAAPASPLDPVFGLIQNGPSRGAKLRPFYGVSPVGRPRAVVLVPESTLF
jgi:hypothetical protein